MDPLSYFTNSLLENVSNSEELSNLLSKYDTSAFTSSEVSSYPSSSNVHQFPNDAAASVAAAAYPAALPQLSALAWWPWQVLLILLYSATAFISLSSNILTIIVLIKGDRISSELWKFLVNLCVSDIAMSVFSIPFTYTIYMLNRWIFPLFLCPVVQFAQIVSVFVSVWTLTIIGIDRYIAIVYPLRQLTGILDWFRDHKWFLISLVWLGGICVGSVQFMKTRAIPFRYGNQIMYDCREEWGEQEDEGKMYTLIIFTLTFALPILILIFVYSIIGLHIWKHVIPGNPDMQRDQTRCYRKEKVIKILIMILLLFSLCWLPIHVLNLLVWFYPKILRVQTDDGYRLFVWSYFACHWLAMAHSFVNPIVYCFMNENFRANLKCFLSKCASRLRCDHNHSFHDEMLHFEEGGSEMTVTHRFQNQQMIPLNSNGNGNGNGHGQTATVAVLQHNNNKTHKHSFRQHGNSGNNERSNSLTTKKTKKICDKDYHQSKSDDHHKEIDV